MSYKLIGFIDTAISSSSLGEQIIVNDCKRIFQEIFPYHFQVGHSSHCQINSYAKYKINQCKYLLVCGTNLLCPDIENYQQWHFKGLENISCKPILMGAGWHRYSDNTTAKSAQGLKQVLNQEYIHAVRDNYTLNKLKEIGIENVINTSCPTLWDCIKHITGIHSNVAVITIHYGFRDILKDLELINFVKRNYGQYYLWPQGYLDYEYAEELKIPKSKILDPKLQALDDMLDLKADYIGLRLHSGIRAIQKGCSSSIIAIDNRAKEMLSDVNVQYFDRDDIYKDLSLNKKCKLSGIDLPIKNINTWLNQFK